MRGQTRTTFEAKPQHNKKSLPQENSEKKLKLRPFKTPPQVAKRLTPSENLHVENIGRAAEWAPRHHAKKVPPMYMNASGHADRGSLGKARRTAERAPLDMA
jgi:hypothetical protein